jgi:predicted RNase H-related nuclease YkuK (DUF458 family)
MESDWIEAKEAIRASSKESSVYIGADSIRYKKKGLFWAKYSVVVILHTDSKHGCRLFHKSYDEPDYGGLKQRLLMEVNYAVTCATEIVEVIGDRTWAIHLDINPDPKHKSSVAVKEALGWVKGMFGVDAVIKPDAFAATHCADHLVRRVN